MKKLSDLDSWYVNATLAVSRVNAIVDSTANQDDFATVHVSINGHTALALSMINTGADITITDRSFAHSLSIAYDKIDAFVVMAIVSQQLQRERSIEPITISCNGHSIVERVEVADLND